MNPGLYFKVAFRNIFRQKKRTFSLGINYAVVTLILLLVFAFSHGASKNISTRLSRATSGHINISGENVIQGRVYIGVLEYKKIAEIVKNALGSETEVYPRYSIWTTTYNKGIPKRLRYYGIFPELEKGLQDQFNFIKGDWDKFVANPDGIIVSKEISEYLELELENEIVVSTRTRFGAFNTATFVVCGIFETDNYFVQNLAIAHFNTLQKLDLADREAASILNVFLPDTKRLERKRDLVIQALRKAGIDANKPENASDAIAATSSASPRYKVEETERDTIRLTVSTLDEVLGIIGQIVMAINGIGGFLAALMLFVIVIAIFINLRMTINDRMQEIGTIRTIGMEAKGIVILFVIENIFLALIFICIGLGLGSGLIALMVYAVKIPIKGAFSLLLNNGKLALSIKGSDIVLIIVTISVFSAIFSYIPSRWAGKIPPAQALRKTI